MRLIIRLLGNMAGIWLATILVSGISFTSGDTPLQTWGTVALLALIFTIINSLVRPMIRVVAFPLYIITFGLFSLVTNAIIFGLLGYFSGVFDLPLTVEGFWAALFCGTLTALVASVVTGALGPLAD